MMGSPIVTTAISKSFRILKLTAMFTRVIIAVVFKGSWLNGVVR